MPFGFPSHQGLIAPLWRIWPDRFSVLALCVGALVPDVVDGFENIVVRGRFEQWIGHSLVGASVVGVPVGLVLTSLVRRSARRLATMHATGAIRGTVRRVATWMRAVDYSTSSSTGSSTGTATGTSTGTPTGTSTGTTSFVRRLGFEALSVWIGALSHVFFDLLSHERSRLLWPFAHDPAWLGAWWRTTWFRVSAPGYPDYPIGPHFVGWVVLSTVGAVMFFRWPPRTHDREAAGT